MKKTFIEKKYSLRPDVKASIEKKLTRLEKFFSDDTETNIKLSCEGNSEKTEITIFENGIFYRSEEYADTVLDALDKCIDIIERQLRKNKTKLKKKLRKDAFENVVYDEETDKEDELTISKVKEFNLKPMTSEEAILQMNLSGHMFYVFTDAETDKTCVVYKRHKDEYGLIITE